MNLIKLKDKVIVIDKCFDFGLSTGIETNPSDINKLLLDVEPNTSGYFYNNNNIFHIAITSTRELNHKHKDLDYIEINYVIGDLIHENLFLEFQQLSEAIFTRKDFEYVRTLKTMKKFKL